MPRWPSKEVNAAEQDIGQQPDILLPSTGPVTRGDDSIEVVDRPISGAAMDLEAFMEEKVEVLVHESTDPNAENPVQASCNGMNQFFFRGQPQVVRRKYVEILARAKTTSVSTREARDMSGDQTYSIAMATALRYPFSVISDPNPRGAAWLKAILQER